MWVKTADSKLINLEKIEAITIINKGPSYSLEAAQPFESRTDNSKSYVILEGSEDDCEIALAEIEAAIVSSSQFIEIK